MVKSFQYKDANEALMAGDEIAIKEALNNAVTLRPDNIIHAPDLLQKVLEPENRFGLPFPWIGWNDYMNGLRPGEVCLIAAGTGIGKSLFSRSIMPCTGPSPAFVWPTWAWRRAVLSP